jgi:putative flippase GtrA
MKEKRKKILISPIMRYFLYSVFVTFIDTAIVWVLYRMLFFDVVTANTIGVVTGFVIHYILSSKAVFQTKFGVISFTIYLGTFFMGLVLADLLIFLGEHYIFVGLSENLSFLLSKGISIAIPFFFLYFTRRTLFEKLKNRTSQS